MSKRKVFIVHGHDRSAQAELARLLERLGLEPIILHEQPDAGATIIEKLERHDDVDYAFVLYTPDDEGHEKKDPPVPLTPRPRQNVVFEHGYFFGHLKRKHVCCLYKKGVECPTNIGGVLYVDFNESIREQSAKIVQELRAAGFDVDANRLLP